MLSHAARSLQRAHEYPDDAKFHPRDRARARSRETVPSLREDTSMAIIVMALSAMAALSLELPRRSSLPCRALSTLSRRSRISLALDGKPQQPAQLPPKPDGFLVVHKPQDWTSFDVVGRVRGVLEKHLKSLGHSFGRKSRLKVGHGGTLDPMATGLLVLGVGGGTKLMQQYLAGSKAYAARAQLGAETDTQDATGNTTREASSEHVTLAQLESAAAGLTGEIMQRPPIYSALRKDGKRLYDLARAGKIQPEEVEKRPITVHQLGVHSFDAASGVFELEVRCSGGTYVRTLIEDIGREVGSAAHMTALERTRHGPFCNVAESDAARAAGDLTAAPFVPAIVEAELSDPLRLLEAVKEATSALDEMRAARGPEESEGDP